MCRPPSRAASPLTPYRAEGNSLSMKITSKGQVTIPPAMRRKHGLRPQCPVELVDQPDGILLVKAGKLPRGRRALATLLRGGKINGNTANWLRFTRGDE